ncbi:MAG: hypothetical protein AAFY19_06475 [Pseudomonadota bacterium]
MAHNVTTKDAKMDGELSELRADIAALRSDFAKLVDDAGTLARSKSDDLLEQGRDAASKAQAELNAQKSRVEDSVRDNPLAAIGIAFGVGVLLAALSRR